MFFIKSLEIGSKPKVIAGGPSIIRLIHKNSKAENGAGKPAKIEARRSGDPASLIASSQKAKDVLGWEPQITDIKEIIGSAWKWHQKVNNI